MIKRIAILAVTALLGIGAAVSVATEASAAPASSHITSIAQVLPEGNNTANFYLKGHCGINEPLGVWSALDWTNYDSGTQQVYHTSFTSSGPGIQLVGVYIDGVYKTNATAAFIYIAGHAPHNVTMVRKDVLFSGNLSCSGRT